MSTTTRQDLASKPTNKTMLLLGELDNIKTYNAKGEKTLANMAWVPIYNIYVFFYQLS